MMPEWWGNETRKNKVNLELIHWKLIRFYGEYKLGIAACISIQFKTLDQKYCTSLSNFDSVMILQFLAELYRFKFNSL